MKRLLFILTFFLIFSNCVAFGEIKTVTKEYKVSANDGFSLQAQLEYPKIKGKKEFSTVVLLHSLGYNSEWWDNLPEELLQNGYAILKIDLRGHGKSVYNSRLIRTSWKNMTNTAYAKYPEDVVSVIQQVIKENNKVKFFDNWVIVGADIGASSAILASDKMTNRPKTIVMLSPVVETKGLYIPVSIAHLDKTDFLSIIGTNDTTSENAQAYLKKFAQAEFVTYTSTSRSTGMLMLKSDNTLSRIITRWIAQYLNQL